MTLKINQLNLKRSSSVCKNLTKELNELLQVKIELIFPDIWNIDYYNWFQDIEKYAFREELRYSFKEVEERLNNAETLFFFILVNNEPEILMLGFLLPNKTKKIFFLDTVAVKHQNKGIGTIILKNLIKWLKKEGYNEIQLDTEEIDEKDILLKKFYEKFGFELKERDVKGNLNMFLIL
jgi:GNAT superfamily N-acetyltransferase